MSLKTERKKAGLTQQQLAGLARVDQGTVSRIEKGRLVSSTFKTLNKLAWALRRCGRKVSAEDLAPSGQLSLIKGNRPRRKRKPAA